VTCYGPGFQAGARDFSLVHNIQTDSGTHPASYPLSTQGSFPTEKGVGVWSWQITSILCQGQEWWSYTSTPLTSSWHSFSLIKQRDNFTYIPLSFLQGGSYLCWPVHGSALHSDQCTAGCGVHTNSADELICLLDDNIWNEVFTIHRSQEVLKMLSVSCGSNSPPMTDCRNQLQKWTLLVGLCGCKAWITVVF
jgi:hypothetical protein